MTSEFRYTPDDDIRVHEEGAIKLLCIPFQSHENGLPEWIKNSADAYLRRGTPPHERIIVVLLRDGRRKTPASISCLDFAGMSSDVIENYFRNWADPDAAKQQKEIRGVQGGHGNGGKCYMTQMFAECSYLSAALDGKGNRYGVKGGSVKFGYIPDRTSGRNFPVLDVVSGLNEALKHTGYSVSDFPGAVHDLLSKASGFTLVTGLDPKGYREGIPSSGLVEGLQEHPQMIQTIQLCRVYVLANGKAEFDGQPLALPDIPPMDEAKEPRAIFIPEKLKDPVSDKRVSTTNDGACPQGSLILKTSTKNMRYRKKLRHSITFYACGGFMGCVPVPDLDIQSPFRDHIYGECDLDSLEPYKQNDRCALAESPLTRAVRKFIEDQIQEYADEFDAKEKRAYDRNERNAITRMNEALDNWKNRFLSDMMEGMWGGGTPPPQPPLPKGSVKRIEVSTTHSRIGLGVSIRPTIKFFDKKERRVQAVPFRWISDDTNVALVDEDLGIINSFSYGTTHIYAETLDGKVQSNQVPLEVVRLVHIHLSPESLEVPLGSRGRIEALCTLPEGESCKDVLLIWNENDPGIARVSSSGLVYAFSLGETFVTAGDDKISAENTTTIRVVEASKREGGKEHGENKGRGYPRVLISGEFDTDPDTGQHRHFSSDTPPVWQDPIDVNRYIWWINSEAPLANLYLDRKREYGSESLAWRMYHLERYIDVIVQIALTCGPSDNEALEASEWISRWGEKVSEIQAAAVQQLSGFISEGALPEE